MIVLSDRQLLFLYSLLVVALGIVLWLQAPPSVRPVLPRQLAVPGRRIIIDPGHGGRDPGALGRTGLKEKEVNLEIALALHRLFSRVGAYTVLTRDGDYDLAGQGEMRFRTMKERDLWERVRLANKQDGDVYISIHVNSFPQSIWSGAQTFYQEGEEESKRLAVAVQTQLALRLGPNRRKAKAADYRVLRSTKMPAVIVEVGFISNPREEQLLSQPEYREKLAEAIFYGVVDYLCARPAAPVQSGGRVGHVFPAVPQKPLEPGQVRLYFADPNNNDLALRPEIRELSAGLKSWDRVGLIRAVLAELGKGPGKNSALLPAAPVGDWVKRVSFSHGVAVVDLKPEFCEFVNGGGASELLAVYAIVNTVAELPEVQKVRLLVDGQAGILGDHVALDRDFAQREDWILLE